MGVDWEKGVRVSSAGLRVSLEKLDWKKDEGPLLESQPGMAAVGP